MNNIGAKDDGAAASDTAYGSLISLVKRLLTKTPGGPRAGANANVAVGVASVTLVAGGTYTGPITIQNSSAAAQNLFLSFNNPATTADFKLVPGASLTLPFGPTNNLYAIASAAAGAGTVIG